MKLGSQTGSLINHLHSRQVIGQPMPKVGMGATVLMWTDRCAATIVEVVSKADGSVDRIAITDDSNTVTKGSGHDGSAEYAFTSNMDGHRTWYRTGADGLWQQTRHNPVTNRWTKAGGAGLRIGARDQYRDPSF